MYKIDFNNGQSVSLEINDKNITVNDQPLALDVKQTPTGEYSIISDGKVYNIFVEQIDRQKKTIDLRINGQYISTKINEPIDQLLANMGLDLSKMQKVEPIKAPMPGLILKIMVEVGQTLKKGDPVLVLEAMKMENVFKATGDATVKSINVQAGKAVEKGEILIELA